jgi:hypothetical protein
MRIFVIGSYRAPNDARRQIFEEACKALGTSLAHRGTSFLLCSDSNLTADPHVLEGARSVVTRQSLDVIFYRPSEEAPLQPLPHAQNLRVVVRRCQGGWRVTHLTAIHDSDAVIALGGRSLGTQTAIYAAELLQKPVILVPCFGGATKEAWAYFRHFYGPEEESVFSQDWGPNSKTFAEQFVTTAFKLAKRNPFRRIRRAAFAWYLLFVLGALACWCTLFFAGVALRIGTVSLIFLLMSASTLGTVLRGILRTLGAMKSEWRTTHPLLEGLAGIILAFALFVLCEAANFVLTGKAVKIDTIEELQRVGFSVSLLSFLSALFLEDAWAILEEKGPAFLRRKVSD